MEFKDNTPRPEMWTAESIVQAVRDGFTFMLPFIHEEMFEPNAYYILGVQYSAFGVTVGPKHTEIIRLTPEGFIEMTLWFQPGMVPNKAFIGPITPNGVGKVWAQVDPEDIDWEILNRGTQIRIKSPLRRTRRNPPIRTVKPLRRHYRRNADLPARRPGRGFITRVEQSKQPIFPIADYIDPAADPDHALLPGVIPKNLPGISMYGVQRLPRGASNFKLLATGQSPLIVVPEGSEWKIKPRTNGRFFSLLNNLDDINLWESMWVECGGKSGIGCVTSTFEIYLVDRFNERYLLTDVAMDFGDESGWVEVRHVGSRGIIRVPIPESVYSVEEIEEGVFRIPNFIPVLSYK